ncbi:MAG: indole-3-glycerol phosphate synthase TrpC [Ginsengibacter sp.]|jgi:indole-3-glycerol phosphate synthase
MRNILETIILQKRIEVAERKKSIPLAELELQSFFKRTPFSLSEFLLDENKTTIIAEFKRKSPSKGIINNTTDVKSVTGNYVKYGACAISILTDEQFFGGSLADLKTARVHQIPILRKDFIIDEYQLIESKANGADIILLIAACLTKNEVKNLSLFSKNIGLNVLLEIHNEQELEHICDSVDVVGINNRNLKDFKVDLQHSIELGKQIPFGKLKIAESGIGDVKTISMLKAHGFNGFLMGEKFMKEEDPGAAFKEFVEELSIKEF